MSLVSLVGGLCVLLIGGELLVRGASSLARDHGVSPLWIGMTIVAFGTSAPELGVNLTAAASNQGDLGFGNVIGSSIANIGLILGLSVVLRPLKIERSLVNRELLVMVAAAVATLAMGMGLTQPWNTTNSGRGFDGADGAVLLAGFAFFLVISFRQAFRSKAEKAQPPSSAAPRATSPSTKRKLVSLATTLIGLVGVVVGADWTVAGAVDVAQRLGLSNTVIGLSVVAVGTSLPELTTSLLAIRAGQDELGLGNIVGSNIFNILLVLGLTATINPVPLPLHGATDMAALCLFSVALWAFARSRRAKIVRLQGALLLSAYVGYLASRF